VREKQATIRKNETKITKITQSVTRRGALKKFGVGLAAVVLTLLELAHKAQADPHCNCGSPALR